MSTGIIRPDDTTTLTIPSDKSQLDSWFNQAVGPLSVQKDSSFDPALVEANAHMKIITVTSDGKGNYKTIQEAINSVPNGNTHRVVIKIGPGTYKEKLRIDINKPFLTLYGDEHNIPTLVYDDNSHRAGSTEKSATFTVSSDYFVGVNLNIVNSAPRPDGKTKGAMALALMLWGDKAAFYNCKFRGFQDTVCDMKGKHFFRKCYIEGTVDFIFGGGTSLYVNTEIHVISGGREAFITSHERDNMSEKGPGFSFNHCTVTGNSKGIAYLGRPWTTKYPRVIFSYSYLSDVVIPEGWRFDKTDSKNNETFYFAECGNNGPGSDFSKRNPFTKKLTDKEVEKFINLHFIDATKWLLPPPKL